MARIEQPPAPSEKIPLFVVPCAAGFFCVGLLVGTLLADSLGVSRGAFLLRFAPLFTWACTFVLALYLGRRPPDRPSVPTESHESGFLWREGRP